MLFDAIVGVGSHSRAVDTRERNVRNEARRKDVVIFEVSRV